MGPEDATFDAQLWPALASLGVDDPEGAQVTGLSAQLVDLSATGQELARIGTAYTGENVSPIPFDTPSSATFLGTRVLVANQAFFGDNRHDAILDVEVGERGHATYVPKSAIWR